MKETKRYRYKYAKRVPKKNNKLILKYFLALSAVFVIFGVSSFVMVRSSNLYPFKEIRQLLVTTAMTTRSHQWIASVVADKKTITAIMDENRVVEPSELVNTDAILKNMKDNQNTDDETSYVELLSMLKRVNVDKDYKELEEGVYIKDVAGDNFKGKMMLILDPARVKVATTRTLGSRGDLVKQMVPMNGGIAGINGGWFADPEFKSSGGVPTGYVIKDGEVVFSSDHTSMIVGLTKDNVLIMGKYTQQEALAIGVRDCLSSSPIIIINGVGVEIKGDGGWGIAPRTIIGQMQDGAIVFLTIDGRQAHSVGASLRQVQEVLMQNNVYNAIMLDGGSSTVMYYDPNSDGNGEYLNSPSLGYERYIPTSFIVTK